MSDSEDDFLAEAQRKAKKAFLTEEIIQQNYSPRLFTQFCDKLKGADIDAYSFEDLQELVRIFKRKYKPGQVDDDEDSEETTQPEAQIKEKPTEREEETEVSPNPPPESDPPLEETKQTPAQVESSDSSDEAPPAPTVISRPESDMYFTGLNVEPVYVEAYPVSSNYIPESDLSAELNAKTTIVKFTVESGGLLSATHVAYEVHTMPFNWRVSRRESDFIWLKTVLQNAYPGYYVPPNPPKKAMDKFAQETLKKRMKFLQEFIDAILRCEIYKRSPIVVGFLRETVPKQFEMLKKQGSKLRRPLKVEDMQSIAGSLMCNPTTSQEYAIRLNTFLSNSELIKKKLKRQTDLLMQAFRALSLQIKTFTESVKELATLQDLIPEAHRHKLIYGELVGILDAWSRHEADLADHIDSGFNAFFKYRYNEMSAVRDMIKDREGYLSNFLKVDRVLKAKKETLWQKGDVMKWDMKPEDTSFGISKLKADKELALSKMLHTETAAMQKVKDLFGFYNFQLHAEVERVLADASETESIHFNSFGEQHIKMMQKIENQWKTLHAKTKHLYLKSPAQADSPVFCDPVAG